MFFRNRKPPTPDRGQAAKPVSPEVKRRLWATVALTFILLIIWFGCTAIGEGSGSPVLFYAVRVVYFLAFAVVLVAYLAYNRGFVNQNVTIEMLPADWSEEKKQGFLEGNRRRAEKSRWMVAIIIPFAVVFMAEALYLFVWDPYISDFFGA